MSTAMRGLVGRKPQVKEHRPRKGERTAKADFTWCGWEPSLQRSDCKTAPAGKTTQMKNVIHVEHSWDGGNRGERAYPYQHSGPVHPGDWGDTRLSNVVADLRERELLREKIRVFNAARKGSPVGVIWGKLHPWGSRVLRGRE